MSYYHPAERLRVLGLALGLLGCGTPFLAAACPELDTHFQKIFENDSARVFTLQLDRLESTSSYCPQHPYFYVVTSDTRTLDTKTGYAGWSHDWHSGEARFVAEPKEHVIRNESATTHRAVVVEILPKLEFNPLSQNYETDDFTADLGSAKPTWSVSVVHGPMSALKTQLGPSDSMNLSGRTRVLIALTDLNLTWAGEDIHLSQQDVKVISPSSDFAITNNGRFPARFITIAF
ncbi:MAG TPA: hypothetical protein VFQ00_04080 [Terriglobales bacterium]|nr:hypothetical protein [Terriglobales bacterium]